MPQSSTQQQIHIDLRHFVTCYQWGTESQRIEQVRRKSHTLRRLYRFPTFTLTAFFNSRLLASTRLQYFTVVLTKAVKTFEKGKCVVSTGSLVHVDRVKPRISQGSRGIPMTNNPLHSWNSDASVSRPRQHSEGASSVLDRDSFTFSAGGSALLGYQGRFVGSVCLRWIGPES